ncbi:Hpt domain-containing protein [bacterium]|nr:Hpt domain-containing protein [candidate division CSSED10-310 bacterium]
MQQFEHDDETGEFMREMQELYLQNADAKISQFTMLFDRLAAHPAQPEVLLEAFRIAHSLAGGAASYGLSAASAIGDRMEHLLEEAHEGRLAIGPGHIAYLRTLVKQLEEYFNVAQKGDIGAEVAIPELAPFLS